MYLSIDFEDFAHDLKRDLGIWETGPLRAEALWQSYELIDGFLQENGGPDGRKATFFCTGVVAERAPDLIAHIAGQGHEIACHYHYHDSMNRQSAQTVDAMLARAKDQLQTAANTAVKGFRAPKFHVNRETPEQYQLIQQYFDYDSSSFFGSPDQCRDFADKMRLSTLHVLPLFSSQYRGRGPQIRLGGTYLKLAPDNVARDLIAQAKTNGLAPHIYLHPYEISGHQAFRVSRQELAALGAKTAAYWGLRQNQWLRLGGKRLLRKIARLLPPEGLSGRLDQLIPQ
ncbi:MAG: polysaccharide deacetylase family protein [Pseudomonadota bacterium]